MTTSYVIVKKFSRFVSKYYYPFMQDSKFVTVPPAIHYSYRISLRGGSYRGGPYVVVSCVLWQQQGTLVAHGNDASRRRHYHGVLTNNVLPVDSFI